MKDLSPNEFRKTVALFVGIVLIVIGIIFIILRIQAEGEVNIQSRPLTGTVKSASAGITLISIGAFLIMWETIPL